MYSGAGEVWRGFAKNAHEGLASAKRVLPFSVLLFCGQVLPLLSLLFGSLDNVSARWAFLALALGMASRAVLAFRFKQPMAGALLQPVAVGLLLLNQWYGALRFWAGKPVGWRGRFLIFVGSILLTGGSLEAAGSMRCPEFNLQDQAGVSHSVRFPRNRPLFIVAATRSGTGKIASWVKPVMDVFGDRVEILGLADVRNVPSVFHGAIRMMIKDGTQWPVLMDWNAKVVPNLCSPDFSIEVFVIDEKGNVRLCLAGAPSSEDLPKVIAELNGILSKRKGSPAK